MEKVSNNDKFESIKSLQSTIRKLEKALTRMTLKGANTALVRKRLKAVNIGLVVLENVWNKTPHPYAKDDLLEARNVVSGLLPTVETSYANSKSGSPQRTLLERRLQALEFVVQAIDDYIP